jgi:hypothetical protein
VLYEVKPNKNPSSPATAVLSIHGTGFRQRLQMGDAEPLVAGVTVSIAGMSLPCANISVVSDCLINVEIPVTSLAARLSEPITAADESDPSSTRLRVPMGTAVVPASQPSESEVAMEAAEGAASGSTQTSPTSSPARTGTGKASPVEVIESFSPDGATAALSATKRVVTFASLLLADVTVGIDAAASGATIPAYALPLSGAATALRALTVTDATNAAVGDTTGIFEGGIRKWLQVIRKQDADAAAAAERARKAAARAAKAAAKLAAAAAVEAEADAEVEEPAVSPSSPATDEEPEPEPEPGRESEAAAAAVINLVDSLNTDDAPVEGSAAGTAEPDAAASADDADTWPLLHLPHSNPPTDTIALVNMARLGRALDALSLTDVLSVPRGSGATGPLLACAPPAPLLSALHTPYSKHSGEWGSAATVLAWAGESPASASALPAALVDGPLRVDYLASLTAVPPYGSTNAVWLGQSEPEGGGSRTSLDYESGERIKPAPGYGPGTAANAAAPGGGGVHAMMMSAAAAGSTNAAAASGLGGGGVGGLLSSVQMSAEAASDAAMYGEAALVSVRVTQADTADAMAAALEWAARAVAVPLAGDVQASAQAGGASGHSHPSNVSALAARRRAFAAAASALVCSCMRGPTLGARAFVSSPDRDRLNVLRLIAAADERAFASAQEQAAVLKAAALASASTEAPAPVGRSLRLKKQRQRSAEEVEAECQVPFVAGLARILLGPAAPTTMVAAAAGTIAREQRRSALALAEAWRGVLEGVMCV